MTLADLPGIKEKRVSGVYFSSPSGGIAALRVSRAITTASDNGSITAYKDDDGKYRCYRSVYCCIQDEATFTSQAALRVWLKEQLPLID